ncbi:unnamed protein product [Ceutorhynchus assimilis]|uniref:Sortilin-related receptor n=1 Tax=Ceutorhynchus assimilis TaxID=467358 RepID=A0A9N9MLI6_9CUCU|nr:unnamed protein product [Ceutorhynchus assimilis]
MRFKPIFLLIFVPFLSAHSLFGNLDLVENRVFTFNFPENDFENGARYRREATNEEADSGLTDDGVYTKISHLNDSHKQLMVHWVGENSKVVICLARDPTFGLYDLQPINPSAVYISYDDGDSYQNRTEQFKLADGNYSVLEKFYNHPRYNTHFVFTEVKHNVLYVTTDHGNEFKRIPLKFTPSELSFHELHANIFVVLDKNDTRHRLWITEDFGETFRQAHEFVKSFYWLKNGDDLLLLVQRYEPTGLGSIIYSNNLFRTRISQVFATNIQDFFIKGDYLFTTKNNSLGNIELYVSYKLNKQLKCVFDTSLNITNYFIADVSGTRALVVASHNEYLSNLYVSDNLNGDSKVRFTLSMENIFAFFPNITWQNSFLHHISEEAFADVYKVEGLNGIYIASKVISRPTINLGPQHLGSMITYDHGASWRLLEPPSKDFEGQDTGCTPSKGCSLHLSQKFSQLYPESRSVPILSSKSAPGVIIATGVLGNNLKGHYGVYISLDAGLTWKQTLRELYFFNMGDHGGIISAVKYYKTKGETRHILYSTDEGMTWNQTQFHNEEIRLYGLMTEPGENTTIFTMFGSLPKEHQWIIAKVDFKKVFKQKCADKDFKMWSPSQTEENRSYIPCILGQQTTYQRRLRNSKCLQGPNFLQLISKKPCECDYMDFECDFGFKKTNQRCVLDKNLIGYDPYKVPQICPQGQFYLRTKGYRKIPNDQCIDGFQDHYLPDPVPCPFTALDDFLLFAQRENISRYNLISGRLEQLPIKNLKNVIAIDFDLENNCVYWADINLDTINRQCFANGSKQETLLANDLASIEGMAYDWIGHLLYFVDGTRSKIELIRTDINHSGRMRKTILDNKQLKKPRGVAVHPQAGYIFWTDWSSESPSVNRANCDGTNPKILFGKEKVEWPNGITIDYIANRIYWVDARKDYIGSADLHGDGFVNIVHNTDVVSHPFAVAVFKSNMYWDDWKKNAIYSSDKDVYKGIEVVVKDLAGLMDLKVYAHGIQIGKNACSNASCPYICVGLPKGGYKCLCPDGMLTSKTDECLCPGEIAPLANGTCPSVGNSCSSEHFSCGNGLCVPKGWRCDGEDDCGDESDEARCGSSTCPSTFHVCGDGKCLPSYWRCDYDTDCADGSDELDCPKQNCTDSQYQCDNGRCVSKNWRCDGENDCRDNSDERNCDPDRPTQCKGEDEFQCKSGAVICIPSTWKCDDEPDCRDGSDELNCLNNTCNDSQFSCGPPNNRCIFNIWVCDGDKDCPDGRDEQNCTNPKEIIPKPTNEFLPDKTNRTCQDWMFKCQNDRCIPFWWKCDGVDDCGDFSDEGGCTKTNPYYPPLVPTTKRPSMPILCGNNQFRCSSGQCILSAWLCDGSYDCPNGEDEQHCEESGNCGIGQYKCVNDGSCISRSLVCNGVPDCPDHTDEAFCQDQYNIPNEPATPSCSVGFFPCDGGSCYPLSVMCDGKPNCKDGYDEQDCSKRSRVYQVMQMGKDMRGSDATTLLLYWAFSPALPDVKLQFLPSISKVGSDKWRNESWTEETEFQFKNLVPFTKYNMTVYVREKDKSIVFPPARYYISYTQEGIPSAPINVKAKQQNGSHVLVTWDAPVIPNGKILDYEIIWTPTETPVRVKSGNNATSKIITADFQHGKSYSFVVTAFNGKFESNQSTPATIVFDGKTTINEIRNLRGNSTNTTVELYWDYDGFMEGFAINITTENPFYLPLESNTTKTSNISLSLAPGVVYYFEVYAYGNNLEGPHSRLEIATLGTPLPSILISQALLVKDVGTTVKLTWQRPDKFSKTEWIYGVYYRTINENIFKPTGTQVTTLSTTISNLHACETYLFAVGIVGPYGFGPLSDKYQKISTSSSQRAPPKKLQVVPEDNDALRIKIMWQPSCINDEKQNYIVTITEQTRHQTWHTSVNKKLTHTVDVENGGVYTITVMTGVFNATPSEAVTYTAPPIYPPLEVRVLPENNGSFFVYWSEHDIKPTGTFSYEVLVQDGSKLEENSAQKFIVDYPPFLYTNDSSTTYTFAVRIKTAKGFISRLSATQSKVSAKLVQESSVNLPAIIVPSLLVVVTLIGVVAFLVIRNRRLHNSFVRFANSHYSSRSGAATFDDNGLEEEESPRIVGFADDEPLVVA